MKNDSERLADNQRSLLLAMQSMALLMHEDGCVEFMNPNALDFFGDLRDDPARDSEELRLTRGRLQSLIASALETGEEHAIGNINGSRVQCSIAPFEGYRGDQLFWLVVKNLSEDSKYREELNRFHQDLEEIIQYKIFQLKESERIRKKLAGQMDDVVDHLEHHPSRGLMVGTSPSMYRLREMVFQIAKTDTTVLITGESGTGKELFVNLIHETSNRKDKPLLKINCTALNDALLESELFGHEKGAFTGAHSRKKGKFEVVNGGTIFLDEIGDISPHMQAVLLRVLQNREFIRVGGSLPIKTDVRVIAATNVNLAEAVKEGRFRLDLFYRLSIFNLAIPPLRDRKEDIPELVTHFTGKYNETFSKVIDSISQTATRKLMNHDWPGNIRELENVIQRAVLLCKTTVLSDQDITFDTALAPKKLNGSLAPLIEQYQQNSLKDFVAACEKELIMHNLEKFQGNVALAAESLEIGKTALYDKLKRYQIVPKTIR